MARENEIRRTLAFEGNVLRHRAVRADAARGNRQRLQGVADHVRYRRRLEAGTDHAIGALLIVADAVLVPFGIVHELAECLGVALAQQIAGLLPAEDRPRRVAPRRAVIGLVPGEKVQGHDGLAGRPLSAAISARQYSAGEIL